MGCSLAGLAEAKGLPIEHLRQLGWRDSNWYGTPAISIPYPNGLRYRVGLTGKNRFRWKEGSSLSLYGADRLQDLSGGIVLLVEGESDTAAGTLMGIPTAGVPGVGTWETEWAKALEGRTVYIWQEPDDGGHNLINRVAQDIPDLRVIQAPPGIKDLCELLDQAGSGAGDMLRELMGEAQPYWPIPDEEESVPNKERNNKLLFRIRDRSALWKSAKQIFPLSSGTKPWIVARMFYNHRDGKALLCDFVSNS
jgi:hypothetical protein